MSQIKAFSHS